MLDVGDGHQLYWERCGTPGGKPAVSFTAGPGAGISPNHRRQFDPAKYDVLLFDQRGAGKSVPHANLEANTTWHLVDDIERLREMCGVDKWMVFGGSWGSTLSLAYAQTHPNRVSELVLRGIFLFGQSELDWLTATARRNCIRTVGTSSWRRCRRRTRRPGRAYRRAADRRRSSGQLRAAKAWSMWEGVTVTLLPDQEMLAEFTEEHHAIAIARIENHYMLTAAGWTKASSEGREKLRGIPGVIVQGRHDLLHPARAQRGN
jgi:proline iminopeptidase